MSVRSHRCGVLLLDHKSGLFQNVKDIGVTELRLNVTALAKLATCTDPRDHTASFPTADGRDAGDRRGRAAQVFVPRKGEVNAWTTRIPCARCANGQNTLIMAGVWTSVCVMFPRSTP